MNCTSPQCGAAPLCAVFPNLKLFLGQQQSRSITYYYFNQQQHGGDRGAIKSSNRDTYKSTMTQIEEIKDIILNMVFTDI